jgi:hypothetical protein
MKIGGFHSGQDIGGHSKMLSIKGEINPPLLSPQIISHCYAFKNIFSGVYGNNIL